jgi:hypothetical protein
MKWFALLFAASICVAMCVASTPKTFTGVIHDNRCMGPNCATQCPVTKSPKYTLQAGDEAWVLSDQKTPSRFTGKKVIVTGTVETGNKLKVISIVPSK